MDPQDVALLGGAAVGLVGVILIGRRAGQRNRARDLEARLSKLRTRTGGGVRTADGRALPATDMRARVEASLRPRGADRPAPRTGPAEATASSRSSASASSPSPAPTMDVTVQAVPKRKGAARAAKGAVPATATPDTRCVLCHTPLGAQAWIACGAPECGRIAHNGCKELVEGCPVCQTPY